MIWHYVENVYLLVSLLMILPGSAARMSQVDGFNNLRPSFTVFVIEPREEVVHCITPRFVGICIIVDA